MNRTEVNHSHQDRERKLMGYIPTVSASNLVGTPTAEEKAQLTCKIFHKCLEIVLQKLKDLSHSGV